jgi:hypothetical protein
MRIGHSKKKKIQRAKNKEMSNRPVAVEFQFSMNSLGGKYCRIHDLCEVE